FLGNRRDPFRLIEARDVYRIGADLLELAATDVEDSRAEEADTGRSPRWPRTAALRRGAPPSSSPSRRRRARCWCLAGRANMEHLWSRAGAALGLCKPIRAVVTPS